MRSQTQLGLIYGLSAQVLWGFLPLYFPLANPSSPLEILVYRIVFSMVTCMLLLTVLRSLPDFWKLWRKPKVVLLTALASVFIAINWLVYIYATATGQVLDASLGYFINPILTALLGVLLLRERMSPLQWTGLGVSALAVLVIIFGYGKIPWISFTLATSFGLYGLFKKQLGSAYSALAGLSLETALLTPLAIVYAVWTLAVGTSAFPHGGTGHTLIVLGLGVITAVPLLFFNAAARRLPLTVLGFIQYVGPLMQFFIGYLILKEDMPASRLAGFALIWVALLLITIDAWKQNRRAQRLLDADGDVVS